ncbi:uncharacterized protein MONOS_9894 [Monocercomonoides exilis]|uniref:uncharacterized protein n=1 Tax=Monocercomonoides exilis TaxID=2049356 RepID=UPI0035599BB7|nr:hypothetical protein MONOS_9894 [Monocercomonoides exilis]|eukprot:MONOS_9894.1-p1 / transcript=MONOS_9894.1 / gene=MONOS_9894 / organism=Monocercomonoides_exilis_PA203 / gene_product=hypothetical protein / transcript_product=hypothetical protein / location=Mono_scaffold00425:15154-18947(+) / protein_length=1099 / sequence_SO=supercontig / SO=protein_coding / is_pseudo=false
MLSKVRPSFPTNLIRNLVIMLSEKDLETQLQAVIALRNLASLSFIHSLEMNCEGLFASLELVLQKFNKLEVFEIGSSTRQRHRQNEIIASVVELLEAIAEEGKEGNEFKLRKRNSSELGEYGIYPTSLLYEICNSALQNGSLNDEEENKEFLFKEEEEEEEEEEEWTIRQRHIAYIGIEEGKRLVVQSGIIHALLSVLHNALHHMSLFKLTCLKNINLMIVYRILRLMLKLVSNASSPLLRQIMFNEAASEPSSSSSSSASASASATASALSLSSLTIEGLSFPVESPVEATSSEGCLLDILRFVVCSETIRWMRLVCENSCLFEKQCSGCCFSPDRFFKVDGNENKQIPLTPLELHYANVQDEEEEVISLLSQNMLPFPKCLVVSLDILVSVTCSLVKANDEVALKQFGKVFLTANGACLLHCLYFLFAICDTIVRQLPQDQYSASQSFASSSSCNVFSPETIFIKNMHSLLSFLLALINCVVRLSSDVEIEAVASGVISALVEGSEDRCREIVNFGGYPSLLREKDMNCCSSIEHFDYNKLPSESGIQPNVTLCKTAVVYGNTIEIKTNGSLAPIVRRRNNEGHSQLCKLVFEAEQETEYAREVSRTYEEVFQIKQDCFLDSIRLNFDSLLEIRENDVETACWSLLVLANEKITSRILLEKGVVHYLLRVLKHPVLSIQLAVVQIFLLLCKRSPEAEKQLIDNGGLTILSQTLYFCSIDLYKEEGKSLLEYINMLFNKEWNKFSLENGKERRNKSTLKRGSKDEGDHDEVVIAEGEEELAKMLIDTSSQMFVLLSPFVLCQKIMQLFQNLLCSNIQEKEAQNHSSKFVSSIMRNDSFETFLSQSQPESAEVIDIPNSVPMEFLLEDPAFINATAGNEGFVSMSRFSTEDKKSSKFTPTDRLALCRPDIASILLSNNNFTIRSISALLLRTGTADGQLIIAALELLYTLSLSAEDDIVQMAYEETLVPALSCALDLSTKSVYNSLLLTVVANIARAGAVFALKTKVYSKINPFYNQMNRFGVIAQLKQHAMQENEEGEGYIVNSTLALCYLFLNKNSYDINCDVIVSTLMNVLISGDDVSKLNALVAFNCYQINEDS